MQATNQYKQQSNFDWSSNPGPDKFNPLRLGLSCRIYFFRIEEFCSYRLGFAFYHSIAFFAKIKLLDDFFTQTVNEFFVQVYFFKNAIFLTFYYTCHITSKRVASLLCTSQRL